MDRACYLSRGRRDLRFGSNVSSRRQVLSSLCYASRSRLLGSGIRTSLSLGSGLQLRLYKGANIEVKIDLEIGPRRLFRSELRYACYTTPWTSATSTDNESGQEERGYDGHPQRLEAVLGSMLFCQGLTHHLEFDRDQAAKISSYSASEGRTRLGPCGRRCHRSRVTMHRSL